MSYLTSAGVNTDDDPNRLYRELTFPVTRLTYDLTRVTTILQLGRPETTERDLDPLRLGQYVHVRVPEISFPLPAWITAVDEGAVEIPDDCWMTPTLLPALLHFFRARSQNGTTMTRLQQRPVSQWREVLLGERRRNGVSVTALVDPQCAASLRDD